MAKSNRALVMSERSKSPTSQTSPTPAMAELHIDEPAPKPPQPPRAAPPPRPSAISKPSAQLTVPGRPADDYADASDEDEDEDDNDPFADHNAVSTPNAERSEPAW